MMMNDKFKELAEKAGFMDSWFSESGDDCEIEIKAFAELIVRECIGIVNDANRGGSNEIWDNAVKFIRRDLQEHFGVEE